MRVDSLGCELIWRLSSKHIIVGMLVYYYYCRIKLNWAFNFILGLSYSLNQIWYLKFVKYICFDIIDQSNVNIKLINAIEETTCYK